MLNPLTQSVHLPVQLPFSPATLLFWEAMVGIGRPHGGYRQNGGDRAVLLVGFLARTPDNNVSQIQLLTDKNPTPFP